MTVSGASPYELEWFKNAVDITENERISLIAHNDGRFSLVIRDCDDDDTGEYCCVAQNEAGRVTCAGWLTVEGIAQRFDHSEAYCLELFLSNFGTYLISSFISNFDRLFEVSVRNLFG